MVERPNAQVWVEGEKDPWHLDSTPTRKPGVSPSKFDAELAIAKSFAVQIKDEDVWPNLPRSHSLPGGVTNISPSENTFRPQVRPAGTPSCIVCSPYPLILHYSALYATPGCLPVAPRYRTLHSDKLQSPCSFRVANTVE